MTINQIVARIQTNVDALNAGQITWKGFEANQRLLWSIANDRSAHVLLKVHRTILRSFRVEDIRTINRVSIES